MVAEGVMVVTEGARGCGYRKKGGKYLVCDGVSQPCPALPLELGRCPCCDGGIKPTRGFAWFSPKLFFKFPCPIDCKTYQEQGRCEPFQQDRAGVMWVGSKFYPTMIDWLAEAEKMGVSKRIPQVPKDLVVGETWVFVAHRKVIEKECERCDASGEDPSAPFDEERGKHTCSDCDGTGLVKVPGVFSMFKPTRIEVVVDADISQKEADKLIKRGLTPVVVNRVDEDGNVVDEDGEPIDEWRTIHCDNPECDSTHVLDIESVHDQELKMAFSGERDRDEYIMESLEDWHSTNKGTFCSVDCMPEDLRQEWLFGTEGE